MGGMEKKNQQNKQKFMARKFRKNKNGCKEKRKEINHARDGPH